MTAMTPDTRQHPRMDALLDGPDALPVGTPTRHRPGTRINMWGDNLPLIRAHEHWRMRNWPHLYHDTDVELMQQYRADLSDTHELEDLDCMSCRIAFFAPTIDTPCPVCGGRNTEC